MKVFAIRTLTVICAWAATAAAHEPAAPPQAKVIRFSGYDWVVKTSAERRVGPGSNYFADESAQVTPQGLKLKIVERDGRYYCGEIISQRSFGYGTYSFTLGSNVDGLAPNLVLGLFTWSGNSDFSNRELDVEISRWGDAESENGQFVVQPYTTPGNIVRFPIPGEIETSVYSFTWVPGSVEFRAEGPGGRLMKAHSFKRRVPEAGGENARINLWLYSGRPPGAGVTEVVISKFEFSPMREQPTPGPTSSARLEPATQQPSEAGQR